MIFFIVYGGNVCWSFDYFEKEVCNNGKLIFICLIVYMNMLF